ncbi:MAG: geranylgeranyl reductase family protein [Syntrophothermus sp.]
MKQYYDIIVVGAGPSGSTAARYAANLGVSVLMLEKDRDVGYPVRCAEAVSKAGLLEFMQPDRRWIASEISKLSFISPDNSAVIVDYPPEAYVLERRIFDYELARMASESGAEVLTRAYVNGLLFEDGAAAGVKFQYRGEEHQVRSKVVIAADGVESRVGRWAGLNTACDFREMECCAQVTLANIKVNKDTCYFYFGRDVAPFGYFWVFPKGENMANVGLGVSGSVGKKRSALSYLNEFLAKRFPEASVLTSISGGVPCAITLDKIAAPGIMLSGDAAHQVNPLSGGGIISGMRGGSLAGRIAAESVLKNNPAHLLTYGKAWHELGGKKHEIYNRLKNGIYNFSDEKFNDIAHSFLKVPVEKRTMGGLFKTALFNHPSLLLDIAKVFVY